MHEPARQFTATSAANDQEKPWRRGGGCHRWLSLRNETHRLKCKHWGCCRQEGGLEDAQALLAVCEATLQGKARGS